MIGRRGFLSVLGGVAATAVLDPEFLLWVPGAKTFSIPSDDSWNAYYAGISEESDEAALNASALAAQLEAIRPEMPALMLSSSVFWDKMDTPSRRLHA